MSKAPSPATTVRFEANNTAAHVPDALETLTAYYNQKRLQAKRTISHGGAPRRYGTENKDGDSTFETLHWTLMAEGGNTTPTGVPGPAANKDFSFSAPLRLS